MERCGGSSTATRYVDQRRVYPVTRPSTRGVRGAVMRKRGTPGSPKDSANSNIKRDPRPASNGSRSRCPLASCPTPAAFARPAPPCLRRPVKLGAVHHPPPTPGREEVPNCHPFLPAAVANWRPELAVDAVSRRTPPGARRPGRSRRPSYPDAAPLHTEHLHSYFRRDPFLVATRRSKVPTPRK